MKPPNKAPAIPSSIVTMKPPGSRPGINSFAITPTTRPNRIHDRIPIRLLLRHSRHCKHETNIYSRGSNCGPPGRDLDLEEHAFVLEQPAFAFEPAAVAHERA